MNTTIEFDDGVIYKFPDISYEKFKQLIFKSGSSDIEYETYLRDNNMIEVTDFSSDSLSELSIVFTNGDRVIKFRCVHDSDTSKSQWTASLPMP